MAEDYLSDREQEEALREWWRENWRWIVGGVVLGLGLLGGWRYWEAHGERRAQEAAVAYEELSSAVQASDYERAEHALSELIDRHAGSAYVEQGRMLLAKMHADREKFDEALALLQAASKADDEELAQVARLRAARIMIHQGRHDDALALLNVAQAGAFLAQVREVRGDALFAKGDQEGARAEYAAALASDSDAQIDRTLLEMKLQDVGGGEPSTADAQAAVQE
ncbi:MAG: tetratricopeptide repeat protein [Steroidobacteraceae bacterium]|jgi:predicted negative regulator of RcsB-dependent stress response|nr:tetratricopeptide repeat protein [Steroidobacteraceae bacterium]